MAANRFGIDVPQLYKDKENIQSARTRNKMSALKLGEAEREIEQRPIKEAAAKKRNAMVTGLREKAIGGDQGARDRLLVIDSTAKEFIAHIDKANEKQANQAKENVEQMGRMLFVVNKEPDPNKREEKYQHARSMLPKATQAKMPKNYNENEVTLTLAKLGLMADIAEYKVLKHGGESLLTKGGEIVERSQVPNKASGGSRSGGGAWKGSTSINTMRKLLADLQGKIFDERTGGIVGLTPGQSSDNQAVITEAARLLRSGQAKDEAEAVTMAAQKLDVPFDIPDLNRQNADNDPLGLR
jgi:hypothetical protein